MVLELGLAVAFALALAAGLAAMKAPSVAETVAVAVAEPDGEAEPDVEAEPDDEGEPDADGEAEADLRGPAVVVLAGLAVAAELDAEPLGDGVGDGDGDGVGVGVGEGVGEGEAVLAAGSDWHVLLVPAAAVTGLSTLASAVPDQAARAPKVTEPPASKLSVIARTCAKRIDMPRLRCSSR